MCWGLRTRERILLLDLFLTVFRLFNKSFRVQLTGKFFDGRDNPRSGAVDGIADDGLAAFVHCVPDTPAGKSGQSFDSGWSCFPITIRKPQHVGFQPAHPSLSTLA